MSKEEQQSLRPVAFAAIVFSTVAITGCLITFPLVFHYVQTLESSVQVEIDFCKVSHGTTHIVHRNVIMMNDDPPSHFMVQSNQQVWSSRVVKFCLNPVCLGGCAAVSGVANALPSTDHAR